MVSAQVVSGWNPEEKTYRAASLEQYSKILETELLKESGAFPCADPKEYIYRVKKFRNLVSTQWNNDVSSLALKVLNENKWNKSASLPLTEDIIKLRDFILKNSEKYFAELKSDARNESAYKNLTNLTLIFTILFNRRRIGDVQLTPLESYSRDFDVTNQSEFFENLTESERALAGSYKRIIADGKHANPIIL